MVSNNNNIPTFINAGLYSGQNDLLKNDPAQVVQQAPVQPQSSDRYIQPTGWGDMFNPKRVLSNLHTSIGDIGTGLTHIWANAPELAGEAFGRGVKYVTSHSPSEIFTDVDKYLGFTTAQDLQDLAERMKNKPLKQVVAEDLRNNRTLYTDLYNIGVDYTGLGTKNIADYIEGKKDIKDLPYDVATNITTEGSGPFLADALTLGLGKGATKGVRAATKAEEALASRTAKATQKANEVRKSLEEINKLDVPTRAKLFKAAEQTGDWSKELAPYRPKMKKFSELYDELIPEYAKVSREEQSIIQKYVRDKNVPYVNAEREIKPLYEQLTSKELTLDAIKEMADKGDDVAKAIYNGKKLYDEGKIFPITHAMEHADEAAKALSAGRSDRKFYGQFSTRNYGLTDYEKMATSLKDDINPILEKQIQEATEGRITKDIVETRTIGGQDITPKSVKDTVYINADALQKGNLAKALDNISKTPVEGVDMIAIDKHIANALKEQLTPLRSAFRDTMQDIYGVQKGTLLSSGLYLGGNFITGTTNALMNSGIGVLDDVINAIGTKGKLAQEMGLFRRDLPKTFNKKPFEYIQKANDITGAKIFRYLDKQIQNNIAEVAAHANLRKRGIKAADRAEYLANASLDDLGKAIVDTRRVALLNSNRTILPRSVTQALSTVIPFWQWSDTAAQSTLHMLRNNPAMANVALIDILANIGLDRELQNRLNLNVSSDKPLVSYRFDSRTGQVMEQRAEFIPMMNTISIINDAGNIVKGKDIESITFTSTALGEIFNAAQGKNTYGKPLRSQGIDVQGSRRYRFNNDTGRWEEVIGGTPQEVLAATARGFFGLPNLANKTILPAAAELISEATGTDYNFYRPDDSTLFGGIYERGYDPSGTQNFFVGGDPTRPREGLQISNTLSGIYERQYYPDRASALSKTQLRSMLRSRGRRYGRAMENINR